ncbi:MULTISPECIES: hypothetical protein [unclassified Nonomuraea]|uniref:hypothetical protein n=1 Tax=unclassified Nonomuraea TaxID=2593643 RepID=UPI0033CC2C98
MTSFARTVCSGAPGLWYRPPRRMEDDLPDAVAGAEIADDLDGVREHADREIALSAGRPTAARG